MKFEMKMVAAAILAAGLVGSNAYAGDPPAPPAKKHVAKKPPKPTVEEQINALRQEFQGQIDGLKSDLATKDQQLKQAQQAAADAQAAAQKAETDATAQQQATSDNAAAVTTLQSTVTDLKANSVSLATTVSDETASIKKAISNPSSLHYKGIGLTPGGYVAGETVYRTKATGGDIPTAFNAIPYEHADAYTLGEFYGSARQSRVTLMAEGKTNWGTLRGYYEADWLGTGISSNNNQSNSYVLRQRVIWGQAETNSHWAFTGGQLWSLATEDKKGISNLSGDIMTPQTIDPNYVAGFVWTRQYGFRVTKTGKYASFGVAAENPQILYTATLAGNTPYAVLGSAGNNGGNYNAAISASATTTYVQNYTGEAGTTSYLPVYNTVVANTNIANLSFNQAPDVIAKVAFDPGWGHYEIIGVGRFAHETVYPGVTTDILKYGGQKDIVTGAAVAPSATTAGAFSNSIGLGGIGGSLRVPIAKVISFGAKGLYGPGMGRYGDSTLADVTVNSWGGLSPRCKRRPGCSSGSTTAATTPAATTGQTRSPPRSDHRPQRSAPPDSPPHRSALQSPRRPNSQPAAHGAATGAHPPRLPWATVHVCSATQPATPTPIPVSTAAPPATTPADPAARKTAMYRRSRAGTGMTFTRVIVVAFARASSTATPYAKAGLVLRASGPRASTT